MVACVMYMMLCNDCCCNMYAYFLRKLRVCIHDSGTELNLCFALAF